MALVLLKAVESLVKESLDEKLNPMQVRVSQLEQQVMELSMKNAADRIMFFPYQ